MDAAASLAGPPLKFAAPTGLHAALRAEVDAYFSRTGLSPTGGLRVVVKSLVILAWLAASYVLLVFVASTAWQAVLASVSLAFAIAGVGFNVQHDGNHGAFSSSRVWSRVAGLSLDLLGGSSYFWRYKHNLYHHTYTNLPGWDNDISLGALGRLSPHQRRLGIHRLQHVYLWPFYGLVSIKWQLYDDYVTLVTGRMGGKPFPRPRGIELALLLAGKVVSLSAALVVPLLSRRPAHVAFFYLLTMGLTGVILSVVFQLAHCVEEARMPPSPGPGERTSFDWARHQLETSVDFARDNPLVTWFLGGLNLQIEHHLFPKVSHVHYPALAPLVARTAALHGAPHRTHPTLLSAIGSHYRFLRALGRPNPTA